jgi:hypothetical protein
MSSGQGPYPGSKDPDRCQGQDRRQVELQDSDRGPHPPHIECLGRLRDGLQVRPEPEHKSNPDPSLAGHEDELRHRLEEVALAPSNTSTEPAPSSTVEHTSISSGLETAQINVVSDPSPLSLVSPSASREPEVLPSPQPHAYTPAPLRFQNPFEPEHPPVLISPQPGSSTPPHDQHQSSHLTHFSREPSHFHGLAHSPNRSQPGSGVLTPTGQHHHKSIRPFVHAVMAFEKGRKFSTGTSVHRKRKMSTLVEKEGAFGPALTVCCSHLLPTVA